MASPRQRAVARASSSAWSNPRLLRRAGVVGTQVTTGAAVSNPDADSASTTASQSSAERALRYFKRATNSRATPSYANAATHSSIPNGGGASGAGASVAAHRSQTGSLAVPQPGQAAGNSNPPIPARHPFHVCTVSCG